jgi:hypothetical protein
MTVGDALRCFQYYFPFEEDNAISAAVPGDYSKNLFQRCHEVMKMRPEIALKKLLQQLASLKIWELFCRLFVHKMLNDVASKYVKFPAIQSHSACFTKIFRRHFFTKCRPGVSFVFNLSFSELFRVQKNLHSLSKTLFRQAEAPNVSWDVGGLGLTCHFLLGR